MIKRILFAVSCIGQAAALPVFAEEPWPLERLVGYAREKSPDAEIAAARISAARAKLEQANAAFWPQISIQSGYTRTNNPMYAFGSILNQRKFTPTLDFNDVPDVDNLNLGGVVELPLYAGGRNVAGRESAQQAQQAARQAGEATRDAVALEAARIFFEVQKARAFVRAAGAAVSAFDGNLGVARRRLAQGTILETEVLDVEVKRAQAQEDLIRARNAEALAGNALGALLGFETGLQVANEAPELKVPPEAAARIRAEILSLQHMQGTAEAQARGAKSGWYPQVSLFGAAEYDRGWELDGDGASYQAGVMAAWKIWDGHLTRGQVREAQAAVESVRQQQRKAEAGVRFEVDQAKLNLKDAQERCIVSRKAVAQAAQSAALTRTRFEQGLSLATQVIDSQTALTAAEVRQAEASADQHIAIAALRRAMGLPILGDGETK